MLALINMTLKNNFPVLIDIQERSTGMSLAINGFNILVIIVTPGSELHEL